MIGRFLKKRQKCAPGDVFLVSLADGTFTAAQVLAFEPHALNSAVCAFTLDRRGRDKPHDFDPAGVVSVQFVTRDLLDSGDWLVVGRASLEHGLGRNELAKQRANQFVGTSVVGSANMIIFLNACFALAPWDSFFDPLYCDKLLLSPDMKPCLVATKSERPNI
ncbi:MAG: hypothetical protein WCC57_20585 [Paracoccaceae bacterium]